MTSNQITSLSEDISNLEISEEEKKSKKALQETLTMSYMYAHEPFAKLPPQYRVRRHFRPIPPKFVFGFGVHMNEITPLAVKVNPSRGARGDPSCVLRDHFDSVCGQKPTFESVYSRESTFVLGLANTYSMTKINVAQVKAARDKIEAELIRLEWPRTKCMWYIAGANNVDREDWYNPDPEYDEADDEANAYLSLLASRANLARSKRSTK